MRHFSISYFVYQRPYNSHKIFVWLNNASSSRFVFYAILILYWERVLHFNDQDRELVRSLNHFLMPILCMQVELEELANAYPNSFFSILLDKVMNIVLNNMHFELSLKRYGINLLRKLAKYFMILSALKPKTFRVLIEYWEGFTFWEYIIIILLLYYLVINEVF